MRRNKLVYLLIVIILVFSIGCEEKKQNETTIPHTSSPTNHPPVAKFTIYPEKPRDAERIMFQNRSTDPDNDPLRFKWYIDGKYDCSCFSISEKLSEGKHTVKLVATDDKGNEDEYVLKFYVSETFIDEDVSELVLKREDVGMAWIPVMNEYSGENAYHTAFENGDKRIECVVEKYDTVEEAENRFKEYFARPLPYPPIGNESTYTENDYIDVIFRYGNIICKVSMNTTLEDAILYAKTLEAKLNQVS